MYKLKTLSVLVAAIAFAGCEAGIQDGGDPALSGMNGLVVDGRVANGRVWADRNNNNSLDDFEPFAWTDSQGFYSYNPTTGVNYCADPLNEVSMKHCLQYGSSLDNVVIRVRGGIDLDTGERLKGVMSMETTISDSAPASAEPLVLSPITTILERTPQGNKGVVKSALGIDSDDDLRRDFTSIEGFDAELYANALAVQTLLDIASEAGSADDEKQLVILDKITERFVTLAQASGGSSVSISSFGNDDIGEILDTAGVTTNKARIQDNISTVAARISELSNETTVANAKRRVKAVEVLSKLTKDNAASATDLSNKIVNLSDNINTLMNNIGENDIDIAAIVKSVKDSETINIADVVKDNKLASEAFGGNWYVFRPSADMMSDVTGNENYIAMYFDGDANSSAGNFGSCVNIQTSETLSEEVPNLTQAYFGGTWSKIGASSATLIFDYEGQEFEGVIKARASFVPGVYTDTNEDGEDGLQSFLLTSDLAENGESATLLRDVTGGSRLSSEAFNSKTDQYCASIHSQITQVLSSKL